MYISTRTYGAIGWLAFGALLVCPKAAVAEEHKFTVDGLSGEIDPPPPPVVHRGDAVVVEICPADLLNYEYTISKSEEVLREGFPIVGVEPAAATPTSDTGSRTAAGSARVKGAANILAEYKLLRTRIAGERAAVADEVAKVDRVSSSPITFQGCGAWPSAITRLAGGDPPPFFAIYDTRLEKVNELESERLALLASIEDEELAEYAAGKDEAPKLVKELATFVEGLQSDTASMRSELARARAIVQRWAQIIALHDKPKLQQRYLMPQTSARVTISIGRKPITTPARLEAPEGTTVEKIATAVIAVTTFESRAAHHFNVSLGMVGGWRDDSRTFSIAPSLDSESKVTHSVRESAQSELTNEFAAFLGIYLDPAGIDPYAPERGPKWMAMIGAELSSSPENYYLGLGRDSRSGVVLGFGAMRYESTSLASGWHVGRTVPTGADNKPIIATPPTRTKDDWAPYAFLGFRPSIFRAFLDRRKF